MNASEPAAASSPAVPPTAARVATVVGAATVAAHLSQLAWLVLGTRVMELSTFGAVLAAQALYAVLQALVDVGPAQLGARRAARGAVDERVRGALTRTRLTLALPAAAGALVFALAGHGATALAVAPFAVALPLFALLNVWERFGRADSAPQATYVFLRGAAPALAAGVCFALSATFPPYLAGVAECAAIIAVMAVYRLRPLHLARLARSHRREPLRVIAGIGGLAILFQLSIASGTLLLSASGANAAAAVMGIGVRLVTGANGLLGVLSSAIFPRLARTSADPSAAAGNAGVVQIVLGCVAAGAAALAAIGIAAPGTILTFFVRDATGQGEVSLILVLAALPAAASSIVLSTVAVARQFEGRMLGPCAGGAAAAVALGCLALAVAPANPAAMAAALLAGQLVIVFGLAARARKAFLELRPAARMACADATIVAACAAAGAAAAGAARAAAALPVVALCVVRGWAAVRALHARLPSAPVARPDR